MSDMNAVFKALRKRGFIARQGFMCCSSCASAAIATNVENMHEDRREKVRGAVFYTKQDRERANTRNWGKPPSHQFYLKYGQVEFGYNGSGSGDHKTVGISTVEIGKEVCAVLKEHGFEFSWDEDPDLCILVTADV